MRCTTRSLLRWGEENSLRHSQGFSFYFLKTGRFTRRFHDEALVITFERQDRKRCWGGDKTRERSGKRKRTAGGMTSSCRQIGIGLFNRSNRSGTKNHKGLLTNVPL